MGYIRHHAIVVVAFERARAEKARAKAIELGMQATEIVTSHTNAYESFMVAPDGSKEGWEESESGDTRREQFTKWLRADSETTYADWAEVELDSDGDTARLGRHKWETRVVR